MHLKRLPATLITLSSSLQVSFLAKDPVLESATGHVYTLNQKPIFGLAFPPLRSWRLRHAKRKFLLSLIKANLTRRNSVLTTVKKGEMQSSDFMIQPGSRCKKEIHWNASCMYQSFPTHYCPECHASSWAIHTLLKLE